MYKFKWESSLTDSLSKIREQLQESVTKGETVAETIIKEAQGIKKKLDKKNSPIGNEFILMCMLHPIR